MIVVAGGREHGSYRSLKCDSLTRLAWGSFIAHKRSVEAAQRRYMIREQKRFATKHLLTVSFQDKQIHEIVCTAQALQLTRAVLNAKFAHVEPSVFINFDGEPRYENGLVLLDSLGRGSLQRG